MIELEFDWPKRPDVTFVFRLHHRSDAYGLYPEDTGSNALVMGLKRRF